MTIATTLVPELDFRRLAVKAKRAGCLHSEQRKLATSRYEERRNSNKVLLARRNAAKKRSMALMRQRNKVESMSMNVGLAEPFVAYKIQDRYLKYRAGGIGYGKRKLQARLNNAFGYKVLKQNVNKVMANRALRLTLCLGDAPIRTPCLVRDGEQVTRVMAFHHSNLVEKVEPDGTLFAKWIHREPGETTAANLEEFLSLVSEYGNTLHNCIPRKEKGSRTTETRGQSVIQEGTMITASKHNAKTYLMSNDGTPAPPNGFFLVRGKMGAPNKIADKRCKELITPACALAHKALHGFPKKMRELPAAVAQVFDGSKRISYTNILLTVGNLPGEEPLVLELDQDLKWREYQGREAGCVFHNDGNNMPGTPAVAVVLGAYDGFDFYLPTCGYRIKAPSGTVICGELADILHGVGSGTGVRLTICFAQHKCAVTGVLRGPPGQPGRAMVGARLSVSDRERVEKGEDTVKIKGLSMYDFC